MNFIRNRNFRAGPQTSLEGFIYPQNSDKQQKIKVFGRSGGAVNILNDIDSDTPIYYIYSDKSKWDVEMFQQIIWIIRPKK